MEIETDAIILAKGAPNKCRDGRTVMCAIALSERLGLIRIYPLEVTGPGGIGIWSKVSLVLSHSKTDQRSESYRLFDYTVVGELKNREEKRDLLESCILKSGNKDPIDYQNERRKSIAVVRGEGRVGSSLVPRDSVSGGPPEIDEDGFAMAQSEFPYKPYIEWTSIQGKSHRTHLVGQEVYMGMLNNQSTPYRIFENMHIGDRDYDHWLILGNMKDRRNVWVAAHVHRQKKTAQQPMFTNSWIDDGRPKDWPYETQEVVNAKPAEDYPLFSYIT